MGWSVKPVEEIVLEFPVEALRHLEAAQAVLQVKTDLLHLRLDPPAVRDMGLGEEAVIRMEILRAGEHGEQGWPMARGMMESSRLAGDAVRIRAVATTEGTPVSLAGGAALKGIFMAEEAERVSVYRYDEASLAWKPVESRVYANGQGREFVIEAEGPYAAVRTPAVVPFHEVRSGGYH